jgi:hypothetical protein
MAFHVNAEPPFPAPSRGALFSAHEGVIREEVVPNLGDRFLIGPPSEVSEMHDEVASLPSRVSVRAPEKRRQTEE